MGLSHAAIEGVLISHGMSHDEINRALAPSPQIIRTAQELEALDPDTALALPTGGLIQTARELIDFMEVTAHSLCLPAVKVAEGAHLRACREALERDT
ncbi:hypothetical protein [Corynebacterium kalidii]